MVDISVVFTPVREEADDGVEEEQEDEEEDEDLLHTHTEGGFGDGRRGRKIIRQMRYFYSGGEVWAVTARTGGGGGKRGGGGGHGHLVVILCQSITH